MTTTKLELTGGTCAHKISAYKTAYVNDKVEKCRSCDEDLQSRCDDYFPIYRTQEPVSSSFVVVICFSPLLIV